MRIRRKVRTIRAPVAIDRHLRARALTAGPEMHLAAADGAVGGVEAGRADRAASGPEREVLGVGSADVVVVVGLAADFGQEAERPILGEGCAGGEGNGGEEL